MLRFRAFVGVATAAFLALAAPAVAQTNHDGDYAGVLDAGQQKLHLVLHVRTDKGETSAILDSADQGAQIPSSAYKAEGDKVSILFLEVGGELEGAFSPDGATFAGTWKQGLTLPLTLSRQTAKP